MLEKYPWARWVALILVGSYIEHRALRLPHPNHTFSHFVRVIFKTETSNIGRALFLVGWGALSTWFVPHILKKRKLPDAQSLL